MDPIPTQLFDSQVSNIPLSTNYHHYSLLSFLAMDYLGVCFQLLTFEKGWRFSKAMHHFVFIIIIVAFLVFRFGGIPQKAAKLEAKLKAKALAKTEQETKKSQ